MIGTWNPEYIPHSNTKSNQPHHTHFFEIPHSLPIMATHLRQVFTQKANLNLPVFVTFVTAGQSFSLRLLTDFPLANVFCSTPGFPNPQSTVPILLALEAGGADIIELGVPFSDPLADGVVIQDSNNVSPCIFSPSHTTSFKKRHSRSILLPSIRSLSLTMSTM